jgi:tRNA nucleotidyltransferase/poly(A) polymerase
VTIQLFEVGGCVRDGLMGLRTKDIDFAVEAPSFDAMREFLVERGFTIFVETPHFFTIRAHFPADHPEFGRTTADFVLCRKDVHVESPVVALSTPEFVVTQLLPDGSEVVLPMRAGRHPSRVEVGTIFDDLARRDFTVNAMARRLMADGTVGPLLDPHDGMDDLSTRTLRFVGDPAERIREDSLRILRGVRFMVTKGFTPAPDTWTAMCDPAGHELLVSVSTERVKEELERCFKRDTILTMQLLDELDLFVPLFSRAGIRLTTTLKG